MEKNGGHSHHHLPGLSRRSRWKQFAPLRLADPVDHKAPTQSGKNYSSSGCWGAASQSEPGQGPHCKYKWQETIVNTYISPMSDNKLLKTWVEAKAQCWALGRWHGKDKTYFRGVLRKSTNRVSVICGDDTRGPECRVGGSRGMGVRAPGHSPPAPLLHYWGLHPVPYSSQLTRNRLFFQIGHSSPCRETVLYPEHVKALCTRFKAEWWSVGCKCLLWAVPCVQVVDPTLQLPNRANGYHSTAIM